MALPKASGIAASAEKGVVQDLRKLMVEVDDIKKERDALEEMFKATSMDMAPKFLQALASDGFIDTEKISEQSLEEIYGASLKECEENLQKQQDLVSRIQVINLSSVSIIQQVVTAKSPICELLYIFCNICNISHSTTALPDENIHGLSNNLSPMNFEKHH